jgi:hypothetical protein
MRIGLATVVTLLCVCTAAGQTVSDIEGRYGKPSNVYSVSEHIWMMSEYAADGQVCRARLFPKRVSTDTNYLSVKLPSEELREVLNQMAPLVARGVKKEPFGVTATGGGAAWTTYPYEKVTFTFTSSFEVDADPENRLKPYTFSVRESSSTIKAGNTAPSDADLFPGRASGAEVVTLKWNDRRCAGN